VTVTSLPEIIHHSPVIARVMPMAINPRPRAARKATATSPVRIPMASPIIKTTYEDQATDSSATDVFAFH